MDKKLLTSIIFNNLRVLHKLTPQDTYIANYLWHLEKEKENFFDIYCLAFWWGSYFRPKRIMEIGSRTGLSLVQLLSAYPAHPKDMRVVLFDRWDDGLSCPELIKKHLDYLGIPMDSIEFYTGDSKETVPEFKKYNPNEKFDWVLVDGSHEYDWVKNDLQNVVDIIAKSGVIVADDLSGEAGPGVAKAWDEFKEKYFDEFSWNEDHSGKGTAWAIKL